MTHRQVDILVIGSGFGGALMAMIARRLGFSTLLVERRRHPRFAIGESSTPLANLLLEEIASDYDLPRVRPLCKWGTWQKHAPRVACGLKRGFTFFHHTPGRAFDPDPSRERQLLVGASPTPELADTHWYRADVDHYLVNQAQALGIEFWDETDLSEAEIHARDMSLKGTRQDDRLEFKAELVIDASGPRGCLSRLLRLPEEPVEGMPPTQALFSHFIGVEPLPECFSVAGLSPPYPIEDAAVHHLFRGGWIWVLKFNNGITSAGVAATDTFANALPLGAGEPAWLNLLSQFPSLAESFRHARNALPFFFQPRVAFQSANVTGPNWILLPSAAGVIDPLLSTGFPLTLLGIARLGRLLKEHWRARSFAEALTEYERVTRLEFKITAQLIAALYSTMNDFEAFRLISLLYFAGASFAESARRLGKTPLADTFLLCQNPEFSRLVRQVCDVARGPDRNSLEKLVYEGLPPFDVAGLCDRSRHPWYPALPADLLRNGWKLEDPRRGCRNAWQLRRMKKFFG